MLKPNGNMICSAFEFIFQVYLDEVVFVDAWKNPAYSSAKKQ